MADTTRKPTARMRSKTHRSNTEPLSSDHHPSLSPTPSTPKQPTRQAAYLAQFRSLQRGIADIDRAVEVAMQSYALTRGATVSIARRNLVGQKLFAVSIFPSRTVELTAPPTRSDFLAFAILHFDVLRMSDHALGGWFDRYGTFHHFLDVVVCVADLEEALELGRRHGQRFVYDLEHQQDIAVPYPISVQGVRVVEVVND